MVLNGTNDMKTLIFSLLTVILSAGCASQVQTTDSSPTSNLQVQTSGHSSGEAIYWGEAVGYAQISPELNSHIPEIAKTLKKKGLILNTKSPYASLQLTIDLRSTGQGLSTTVKLMRIKDRDRGVLVFPLQGTTIAVSYAQIEGQISSSDRKAIIAQLVNQALAEFSIQLDKSKPGSLRAIPL